VAVAVPPIWREGHRNRAACQGGETRSAVVGLRERRRGVAGDFDPGHGLWRLGQVGDGYYFWGARLAYADITEIQAGG
jgi:hypothetical protein